MKNPLIKTKALPQLASIVKVDRKKKKFPDVFLIMLRGSFKNKES